ncbi:MAG: hypothetical protein IT365_25075 [Candidatus Hydrogenedentes bacterium]|nr:hypothetical protein [Candidatus Hydrogenedentota bacterium]
MYSFTWEERAKNLASFVNVIRDNSQSYDLDFVQLDVESGDAFDLLISDVALLQNLTLRELPAFKSVVSSDLFVPCSDPGERFHFEFAFSSEGKKTTWLVTDINSLKDWVSAIRGYSKSQSKYDPQKIESGVGSYEQAIFLAQKLKFLLLFSY